MEIDKSLIEAKVKEALASLTNIEEPYKIALLPKVFELTFAAENPAVRVRSKDTIKKTGLGGGINLLIQEGFLKSPRFLNEIHSELKRIGYIYPLTSLPSVLLSKIKGRTLTRIEEGKKWKYVVTK